METWYASAERRQSPLELSGSAASDLVAFGSDGGLNLTSGAGLPPDLAILAACGLLDSFPPTLAGLSIYRGGVGRSQEEWTCEALALSAAMSSRFAERSSSGSQPFARISPSMWISAINANMSRPALLLARD